MLLIGATKSLSFHHQFLALIFEMFGIFILSDMFTEDFLTKLWLPIPLRYQFLDDRPPPPLPVMDIEPQPFGKNAIVSCLNQSQKGIFFSS